MSDLPPTDSARPTGPDASDPANAAAAQAEREEALRILLATPGDEVPRPARLTVPAIDGPVSLSQEISLPVIPSAARMASAPWTFAEVVLGFLVVVLAGALTLSAGNEFRDRARAARTASELRTLAAAFANHHRETGKWPRAATAREAVPVGLEKSLSADVWSRPTPVGGHYAWVTRAQKPPALAITAFVPDAPLAISREQQRRIDRLLDDGNLETGRFRIGFNGWPVYFLGDEN